jgi:alkyl sulfatase BDS1-like metallo-beta-lactamase superfamily hydrolase
VRAFGIAVLLSAVNPKNLSLTAAAAVTIAQERLSTANAAFVLVLFAVLASLSIAVPVEIAEMLKLPEALDHHWALRGYYGTVNHNVKATYVKYLGWFDGNPANLHVLPPEESATRYVEFMGGADAILDKARSAYDRGEYRWVAEVVNHLVFAEPTNQAARELQADVVEQMGYQSEAGTWRGLYLTAAKELREGVTKLPIPGTASPDSVRAMTLELLLNYMGVRLNGPNAAAKRLTLDLEITDTGEQAIIELVNGSLNHSLGRRVDNPDATIKLTKEAFAAVFLGEKTPAEVAGAGQLEATPDTCAIVA